MSQQGYLAQSKTAHPAFKPAMVTLLLAGSAVLYTAWQPAPAGKPEPATGSGNGARVSHEAAGNPAAGQNGAIAIAPDFGKPAEPAPDAGVAGTLASAVSSAVETVQASVTGGNAAPAGEKPAQAVTRIVLPDSAPLPAATVRVALPEPAPAAAAPPHSELASTEPVSGLGQPEAAAAASDPTAASPGTPEAGQPPLPPAPAGMAEQPADPPHVAAPATAVAPTVVPPVSSSVPAPAEESDAMRVFGDARYVPLSEARLDSTRPIGASALTHVSTEAASPEVSLTPAEAVPANPAASAPKTTMQMRSGHPLAVHLAPGGDPSLHLKELVGVFAQQLDPRLVDAVAASPALDTLVSFDRLRAAGIAVRHDAARDLVILAAARA